MGLKTWAAAALIAATFSTTAQADWCDCDFDGSWCVGAEAVYLKPCLSSYYWGQKHVSNTVENFDSQIVKSDYNWGFRLYGLYESCDQCTVGMIDWTWLRATDTHTTFPPEGGDLFIFTGTGEEETTTRGTGRVKLDYDRVNLRLGRLFCNHCCSQLYGFAGVGYFRIKEDDSLQALEMNGTTDLFESCYHSEVEGFLFSVGMAGEAPLWCGLGFKASFSLNIGLGEKQFSYKSREFEGATLDGGQNTRDPSHWGCVPGIDIRLGFDYTYTCGCWTVVGELGWQADYYFSALNYPSTDIVSQQGDNAGTGRAQRNVAFAGPYAGLSFCF